MSALDELLINYNGREGNARVYSEKLVGGCAGFEKVFA